MKTATTFMHQLSTLESRLGIRGGNTCSTCSGQGAEGGSVAVIAPINGGTVDVPKPSGCPECGRVSRRVPQSVVVLHDGTPSIRAEAGDRPDGRPRGR